MKKETPESVFGVIKEGLTDYDVILSDELDSSSDYDIVIIVGSH